MAWPITEPSRFFRNHVSYHIFGMRISKYTLRHFNVDCGKYLVHWVSHGLTKHILQDTNKFICRLLFFWLDIASGFTLVGNVTQFVFTWSQIHKEKPVFLNPVLTGRFQSFRGQPFKAVFTDYIVTNNTVTRHLKTICLVMTPTRFLKFCYIFFWDIQ